jgi:hypothetical protein
VVTTEQLTIEPEVPLSRQGTAGRATTEERIAAERAARESLRAQVARLEHQLSAIVARGFPHIDPLPARAAAPAAAGYAASSPFAARHGGAWGDPRRSSTGGPRLLTLAELERTRDRLVVCLRQAQAQARQRSELELRSRELLERMRLEPGRYKFRRLRVADLGEQGCGVWEVRPRLGLIGMLAGWWQLKLSSGCPLPWAARSRRAASPSVKRHTRVRGTGRSRRAPSPSGRVRSVARAGRAWSRLP